MWRLIDITETCSKNRPAETTLLTLCEILGSAMVTFAAFICWV